MIDRFERWVRSDRNKSPWTLEVRGEEITAQRQAMKKTLQTMCRNGDISEDSGVRFTDIWGLRAYARQGKLLPGKNSEGEFWATMAHGGNLPVNLAAEPAVTAYVSDKWNGVVVLIPKGYSGPVARLPAELPPRGRASASPPSTPGMLLAG